MIDYDAIGYYSTNVDDAMMFLGYRTDVLRETRYY